MYSVVKETSQIYYRENSDDLFDNSETIVVELASARRFSPQFSKEPQRDRSIRTFIAVSIRNGRCNAFRINDGMIMRMEYFFF